MMKSIFYFVLVLLSYCCFPVLDAAASSRSHSVRGYYRSNGTYVAPHHATNRNGTKLDNWSTKGNVNPYTGKAGTKNPY